MNLEIVIHALKIDWRRVVGNNGGLADTAEMRGIGWLRSREAPWDWWTCKGTFLINTSAQRPTRARDMDEDDDDDDAALLLRVAQSSHTELPVGTRYHLPSSAKGGRTLKATTMPARTHQQQPRQSNRHPHNGKKSRGGGCGRSAFARNVVSRRAQTDPLPDLQPTMKLDLISYLPPPAPPRDGVDVQLGERCARRLRQSSRQGESGITRPWPTISARLNREWLSERSILSFPLLRADSSRLVWLDSSSPHECRARRIQTSSWMLWNTEPMPNEACVVEEEPHSGVSGDIDIYIYIYMIIIII